MTKARRPNAAAVAAKRIVVAGMNPPLRPIIAIRMARPPRMNRIAL